MTGGMSLTSSGWLGRPFCLDDWWLLLIKAFCAFSFTIILPSPCFPSCLGDAEHVPLFGAPIYYRQTPNKMVSSDLLGLAKCGMLGDDVAV